MMNKLRKHRRPARGFESLEARCVLDASFAPLGADAYLTLSFAPDGTDVAGRPSTLAATFNALGPQQAWQDAILRAFQTWTQHANADVGLVSDSGAALGTPGAMRDDARFGDIRIAAVAMSPEIGAISVPIDSVLSGTWHADVVFNTAFPYQSLDDVFAIAMHEAGNVLGLKDNNDPASPLRAGPIPTSIVPTSADIALLQDLHGERAPDINELGDDNDPDPNDSRATATDWNVLPGASGPAGSLPAVAQGDIQSPADVDYFELEIPDGYSGPITITLRTDGVSVLRPRLRVESMTGANLGEIAGAGDRGDRVSLTVNTLPGQESLYARVSAATGGLYGVGGFALSATFDAANTASPAQLEAATDGSLRNVDIIDFQQLVGPGEEAFRNDLGANDTLGSATPLNSAAGFAPGSRFETVASISVVGDIDYYRITPDTSAGAFAYVTLRSLNAGRLVPAVEAFDELGATLPSRLLVNGAGELLLEVDISTLSGDLYVKVAASPTAGPFQRGNYAIAVGVAPTPPTLTVFAAGGLANAAAVAEHTLYAAEPQLFHFVLTASAPTAVSSAAVIAEIRNSSGIVVHTIAAPVGESRSAGAVFLPTGEYTVVIKSVALGDSFAGTLTYSLAGAPFSDPFVGDGSDPTTNPFTCGSGNPGFYCYPGGIVSSDPFLWDDFVNSLAQNPTPGDTAAEVRRLLGDWWNWVWVSLGVNGPPLAMSDDFTTSAGANLRQDPGLALSLSPPNVLSNDVEPELDPVVAVLAIAPQNGTVTLRPDGTFVYVPTPGFVGFDWFRYTAYDFITESNSATVWITVQGSTTVAGDYNGDGQVTLSDAAFWRANYGESGGPADGNGDGLVDSADYALWRDAHDAPPPALVVSPPAPIPPAPNLVEQNESPAQPASVPGVRLPLLPTVATESPSRGVQRESSVSMRGPTLARNTQLLQAAQLTQASAPAAREEAFAILAAEDRGALATEPEVSPGLRRGFRPAVRP